MTAPNQIVDHINELITYLVTISLADDQCFAFQRSDRDIVQVTFAGAEHVSIALRDRSYREIYQHLFQNNPDISRLDDCPRPGHRLGLLPEPALEELQVEIVEEFLGNSLCL